MDFSTLTFLFAFLPIFLLLWLLLRAEFRLPAILLLNFVFIFLGHPASLLPLIGIVIISYGVGQGVEILKKEEKKYQYLLWGGILFILGILSLQKILTAYDLNILDQEGEVFSYLPILGLSYVAFQVIAYLADVSRGIIPAEKDLVKFSAFMLFFPKIVSGPIMRYKPFVDQIPSLSFSLENTMDGLRRIMIGVVKRLLVANQLGLVADSVFGLDTPNVAPFFAWLGLIAYTFQIFFDFSGYTDIALGLGRIIGITLPENFNFPYIAQSIGDFWRRWHMTLSGWFREYVFFPLERKRFRFAGQQINMLVVFLLTGLWHGFTLNFLIWGGIHGVALVIESFGGGRWQKSLWRPIRHVATIFVIMLSWIFFRSSSVEFSIGFIKRLLGDTSGLVPISFSQTTPLPFIEPTFVIILLFAIMFSMPLSNLWGALKHKFEGKSPYLGFAFQLTADMAMVILFLVSIGSYLSGSFRPSIYAAF